MVTSTVRRPGRRYVSRPASWAPLGQWRLYRAWGDLPRESGLRRRLASWLLGGWQQLLYIGITERTAVARWAEHCGDKRWAPDVACWERDPRVWASEADVLAAERAAIIAERPVHNVVHNGNNPGAVRIRRHLPAHVVRARIRWAARLCVGLALFAGFWLAGADVWQGWDGPRNAVIGASIVMAAAAVARDRLSRPKRRRRGRRR
ncbi:hypothetical protein ACVCAH_11460 [Micromonospora sp. LZ34]